MKKWRHGIELCNLRTFLAIADRGGYERAARELGYTQSTVTAQIQQLERELGVSLFERVGRKMQLTPMGQMALEQAREVLRVEELCSCELVLLAAPAARRIFDELEGNRSK